MRTEEPAHHGIMLWHHYIMIDDYKSSGDKLHNNIIISKFRNELMIYSVNSTFLNILQLKQTQIFS